MGQVSRKRARGRVGTNRVGGMESLKCISLTEPSRRPLFLRRRDDVPAGHGRILGGGQVREAVEQKPTRCSDSA
jgi:hypothetical protein